MSNIVVLMAGEGTRFSELDVPKPLVTFDSIPLFHYPTEYFNRKSFSDRFIFVIQKKHINCYDFETFLSSNYSNYKVVVQDGKRNGAAFSAMECLDELDLTEDLFILDCDQYNVFDYNAMRNEVHNKNLSGAILTYYSNNPGHCYISSDESGVIDGIEEKNQLYEFAASGIYYWKNVNDFKKYAEAAMLKNSGGEVYISDVYKQAIQDGNRFLNFKARYSISIGDTRSYYDFLNKLYFKECSHSLLAMSRFGTQYMCDEVGLENIDKFKVFKVKGLSIINNTSNSEIKKFYGKTYIFTYEAAFFHTFYDRLTQYHMLKSIFPDINIVFVTPDNLSQENLFKNPCQHNHLKQIPAPCTLSNNDGGTNNLNEYESFLNSIGKNMAFMQDIHREYDKSNSIYGLCNDNMWFEEAVFMHDREGVFSPVMIDKHWPVKSMERGTREYIKHVFSNYKLVKDHWLEKVSLFSNKEKIFISRKYNNSKIMSATNAGALDSKRNTQRHEDVVCKIMQDLGFKVYDFEGMSFLDQVQIVANSDTVVALSGSGLHNSFFMENGGQVIEISNYDWWTPYENMLRSTLEIDYNKMIIADLDIDDKDFESIFLSRISSILGKKYKKNKDN